MLSTRIIQATSTLFLPLLFTGCVATHVNPVTNLTPTVVSGNWVIYNLSVDNAASTSANGLPFSFGGSLIVTGKNQISGVFHMNQPCLSSGAADIPYTGTISGDQINLTSTSVNSEVLSVQGSIDSSGTSFHSGSLTLTGPCTGNISALTGPNGPGASYNPIGNQMPPLNNTWSTNPTQTFGQQYAIQLVQASTADAHGNFVLTGSITVQGSPCFTTGILQSPSSISGGAGQLTARFNDGSLLSASLTGLATVGVTKPNLSLSSVTITGGSCNATIPYIHLQ